jgi:hypothetical protein
LKEAKSFVDAGGDWDRRNRLKVIIILIIFTKKSIK